MTDCLIENITLTEYNRYLELHNKYQTMVNYHISDCYCDNCLIRSAISVMIIKNREKFKNEQ